jgi:methyl-accepting chemotaxis protein
VKVLAAKTNDANNQIRKLIVKIREYIDTTIQSIHETNAAIKAVVDNNVAIGQSIENKRDISKHLSEVIESIASGARESAQKARESDSGLKEVTFFSAEVADLAKESAESVAQTAGRIKEIAESSDVVLSGIQTSNSNILRINEFSGNMTRVAKNNNRNAQELIIMTEALDKIVTIFSTCSISDPESGKASQ